MTVSSLTEEEKKHIQKEMDSYASYMTVGLGGVKPKHDTLVMGSGAFVSVGDRYGVLTAAHVWKKKLVKCQRLQLITHDKEFMILVPLNDSNVFVWMPEQDKVEDPKDNRKDICFLQILNPDIIATLKSKCSFYSLDLKASFSIDSPKRQGWMLVGFPDQLQAEGKGETTALSCHPDGFKEYHTFDADWDCLSFDVSKIYEEMGVTSLRGMSGGPVWAFQVYRYPEGNVDLGKNPGDCFLAGVSYYERAERGRVTEVLACGPNSIYSGLLSYIN